MKRWVFFMKLLCDRPYSLPVATDFIRLWHQGRSKTFCNGGGGGGGGRGAMKPAPKALASGEVWGHAPPEKFEI